MLTQSHIAHILVDEADVLSNGPQEDLEVKDLDELATKGEWEKLCSLQLGRTLESHCRRDAIRSLRKVYGGTQTASITVAAANKIEVEHGRIWIGWVNCRIVREVSRVKRYNW